MRAGLDATDWRILKELQANGRITNVELARKVGISPPPCLRRTRALEQAGIIAGYFALLDEKTLDFEAIAFANVGLHSQSEASLRAFENQVLAWPLVRECYMLSGETDFLLKCVAPDLTAFHEFVEELTAAPNVASVKTTLVIRRVKFDPGVPITFGQGRPAAAGGQGRPAAAGGQGRPAAPGGQGRPAAAGGQKRPIPPMAGRRRPDD